MRTRRAALALALALAAAGTGCRKPAPAPVAERTSVPPPASAPAASVPALAGVWTVVGHRMPGISAMSNAEADRWHGRKLRLDVAQAVMDESHCDRPTYTTREVARDSLLGGEFNLTRGNRPALDSLERLTLLEVRCGGSPWTAMGGRLIEVDADRAYAPWDGVFFELARGGPQP